MQIQYVNKQRKYATGPAKDLADAVLGELETRESFCCRMARKGYTCALTVTFVSRMEIRRINAATRGIDKVTDVLSFPMQDLIDGRLTVPLQAADLDYSSGQPTVFLGDILICLEKAEQQARELGHRFEREIAFLAAHGFLHLLGYDHDTLEREKAMLRRQRAVLQKLGLNRGPSPQEAQGDHA
jgi:rRNA maturation RNase YbeY